MIYNTHNQYPQNKDLYQYSQALVQANKQKISLRQDQNSSNTIMCRILSELENLAIFFGYDGPKIFGYYATNPKNFQDIINQILFQMTIFESSYNNFRRNNPSKQYEFPNNLTFQDIVILVNKWKSFVKKNKNHDSYESYYNEFLNILSNNNLSKSFNKQFQDIDKNSPKMTNSELKRVMNAGSTASCYTNEKYNDIEKEIMENGDYKVNVILGGNRQDNKFYRNMDKYDKDFESLKNDLYNNLYLMLGYLELYVLSKSINNIHRIFSKNIRNTNVDAYSEYSKYFDQTYDIYDKIYKEYSFVIPQQEKQKIEENLKILKRNTNDLQAKNECKNVIDYICQNKIPVK